MEEKVCVILASVSSPKSPTKKNKNKTKNLVAEQEKTERNRR